MTEDEVSHLVAAEWPTKELSSSYEILLMRFMSIGEINCSSNVLNVHESNKLPNKDMQELTFLSYYFIDFIAFSIALPVLLLEIHDCLASYYTPTCLRRNINNELISIQSNGDV